jgi:hypothetical protein
MRDPGFPVRPGHDAKLFDFCFTSDNDETGVDAIGIDVNDLACRSILASSSGS